MGACTSKEQQAKEEEERVKNTEIREKRAEECLTSTIYLSSYQTSGTGYIVIRDPRCPYIKPNVSHRADFCYFISSGYENSTNIAEVVSSPFEFYPVGSTIMYSYTKTRDLIININQVIGLITYDPIKGSVKFDTKTFMENHHL